MEERKIYLKDFVEILSASGYRIENMGWENVLDIMCIHFFNEADRSEAEGYPSSAKSYRDKGLLLHDNIHRFQNGEELQYV